MTESIDKDQHQFQEDEAMRFLELLGKDPAVTWFRTLKSLQKNRLNGRAFSS